MENKIPITETLPLKTSSEEREKLQTQKYKMEKPGKESSWVFPKNRGSQTLVNLRDGL